MDALPSRGLLATYWIPDVGIGDKDPLKHVYVPLGDITQYRQRDGSPQSKLVFLFNATFRGTPATFQPPYLDIPPSIQAQVKSGAVRALQSKGVAVVLTLIGQGGEAGMGWRCVPANKRPAFADWLRDMVGPSGLGLDGIDIDDEYGPSGTAQSFIDTVAWVRSRLPNKMLTKALAGDTPDFMSRASTTTPFPSGRLRDFLDLGCTMSYEDTADGLRATAAYYRDLTDKGQAVGLPWERLCIGVAAGPPGGGTRIQPVRDIAAWVASPQSAPLRGMMLFTFSQDIQQFTFAPQNQKMWRNPDDHEWQRAIAASMFPP